MSGSVPWFAALRNRVTTVNDLLVRVVRPMPMPPGVTGSPWPRRQGNGGHGYRGRTLSFKFFGVFVGRRIVEPQVEQLHLKAAHSQKEAS